jgi:hypothetical protein
VADRQGLPDTARSSTVFPSRKLALGNIMSSHSNEKTVIRVQYLHGSSRSVPGTNCINDQEEILTHADPRRANSNLFIDARDTGGRDILNGFLNFRMVRQVISLFSSSGTIATDLDRQPKNNEEIKSLTCCSCLPTQRQLRHRFRRQTV